VLTDGFTPLPKRILVACHGSIHRVLPPLSGLRQNGEMEIEHPAEPDYFDTAVYGRKESGTVS
jgi:hypothetical protein